METQSVDPFTFGLQHPSPINAAATKRAPESATSATAAGRTTSPRSPRPEHTPAAAAQSSVAKAAPSSTPAAAAAGSSSRSKQPATSSPAAARTPAIKTDPDDILDLSGDDGAAMADQPAAPSPRAPSAPPAEQERPYGDDTGMDDLHVDHTTVEDADQPEQLPVNLFSERRNSPALFSPKVGGGLHPTTSAAFAPVQPPSPPPTAASTAAEALPTKLHTPTPVLPPSGASAAPVKSSALALVASAFPAQANAITAAAAAAVTPLSLLSPALPASQVPIPADVRAAADLDAQAGIAHASKSEWAQANTKLTSAIDALHSVSHSYSSVPPMWLKQRSTVLVKLGHNSEAFADAHRMVTYHPQDWSGFYTLSTLLGRDKNYSSALMECRKAWRRVAKRKTTTAVASAAKRAAEGNATALAAAARAEKDAEVDRQKVGDRVHQLEAKLHLPPSKLDFDHELSSEEIAAQEAQEDGAKEGAMALSPPAQQAHADSRLHTPQQHPHRPTSTSPRPSDRLAPTTPASAATSAAVGGRSAPNSPAVHGAKKTLDFGIGGEGTAATTQQIPPSPAKLHAPSSASASSSPSFGPPIVLGTYKLAGSMCTAALADAFRAGFRRVDSGMSYGNEELIGRALAVSGLARSAVSLCSKLSWDQLTSLDNAYTQALVSLKRFDTSYLDQFLLHHPGRSKLPKDSPLHAGSRKECWRGLEKLVSEGKVRQIGVSNFEIKHLSGLMGGGPGASSSSSSVKIRPAVNQIEMHPLMYATQLELVTWCQARGIVIQAYSPLGSGKKDLLGHPLVASIARAVKRSPAEVLLRWSVQHGFVPIVKSVNATHMKQNLACTADPPSFVLSAEQMNTLDNLGQGKDAKRFAWDPRGYA